MPLQKLQFRPGVNRESTTLANEGGWFESDKVRFRSGFPEKIGGWQNDGGTVVATLKPPSGAYWGVAKSMWNWINLSGYNLLSVGTNLKYYIQNSSGGQYNDVTPIRLNTSAGVVTFSAGYSTLSSSITASSTSIPLTASTSFAPSGVVLIDSEQIAYTGNAGGSLTGLTRGYNGTTAASHTSSTAVGSYTVTVTSAGNAAQANDFVTFSGAASLGGNITASILNAEFQIQTVTSNNTFTILCSAAANASDTGTGGASTIGSYQISTGNTTWSYGAGWGAGGWGGSTGPSAFTTLSGTLSTIAFTSLTANLTTSATTVSVAFTSGFGSTGSILIESEVISYTGVTSTSFTGCTRGASGTTAAAHTGALGVSQYTSGVTINCASASAFAAAPSTIYIGSEGISYTGKTGTSFTGCVRAANGTTPNSHANSDAIVQFSTAATGWGSAATTGIGIQIRLWSQRNYGQDLIINPRGGAMYYWANNSNPNIYDRAVVMAAGTTVNGYVMDSSTPSLVNMVLVSDASRFVFAFGCNDPSAALFSATQDPLLIRWSDQNSYSTWYPATTNQAGSTRLSSGSTIITAIQTRQEILVLTDAAIYSLQYIGYPYVWSTQIMGENISIVSPNAIATANNITYWMGADKFYLYSGRVETLPCSIRQYIYDNINLTEAYQIHCGTNEGYNEVWWFYPSITGTNPDGSNGSGSSSSPNTLIDRYVIYNHLERTWYYGTFNCTGGTTDGVSYASVRPRTAWLDSPLRTEPTAAIAYVSGNSYTNGDTVYHETGVDNNETGTKYAIDSFVQSSDFDIGDGHNYGFIWRVIPDVTFDGSNTAAPSLNFTIKPRQNPGSAYGDADNPSVASVNNYASSPYYNVQQFTQIVYVRARGRQMAFRVESNSLNGAAGTNGVGVQWQLGTPRIDVRPDGRR